MRRTRLLKPGPRFDMSAITTGKETDMGESTNTPTVVLVHGGFADASFWVPVIKDLQARVVRRDLRRVR
jgi:pimeloyl-ACP methyl ester carboxylesterase